MKMSGPGTAILCVTTCDAQGKVIDWSYAERTCSNTKQWKHLRSRFLVPPGVSEIQPRLIGYGLADMLVDDCSLTKLPGFNRANAARIPGELTISNSALVVRFNTTNACFSVLDRRTSRSWAQKSV